jgi:hypothetical protein
VIPLLAAVMTLNWSDPDSVGEALRDGGTAWRIESDDASIAAAAAGCGAKTSSVAKFRNRFRYGGVTFVVQTESNRPVALVESGKTIQIEGATISGMFRPERRNPVLDLLADIPTLPPVFVADKPDFEKRIRTLSASVPAGCTLDLKWFRPVIGLAALKVTAGQPLPEPEIQRFVRAWIRPEGGMRLTAKWRTPYGEFSQESRLYAKLPVRVYATASDWWMESPKPDAELEVSQSNFNFRIRPGRTGFGAAFRRPDQVLLTVRENGVIAWVAEPARVQTLTLEANLPDGDAIPITFATNEGVEVHFLLNGTPITRKLTPIDGFARFLLPEGRKRAITWIKSLSGNTSVTPVLTALMPVDFA